MTIMELRQHPVYPEVWVSETGRVFTERLGYVDTQYGYVHVAIGRDKRARRAHVVCEAWHGKRPDGHVVRHLDGDPENDNPANLAWGTPADNSADMVRHGRSQRGTKSVFARITEDQARQIKSRVLAGESGSVLAREFGVSPQAVCDIKKGRAWAWLNV